MNSAHGPFRLAVVAALVFQASMHTWFITSHSATFDEPYFISSGLYMWKTGRDDLMFEHPPIAKRLAGLAALLAGARYDVAKQDKAGSWTLFTLNRDRAGRILLFARIVTVSAALTLTALAAVWAAEFWGPAAGALAAWLIALEPNTLAHGSVATCDILLSLALILYARTLWKMLSGTGGKLRREEAGFWAGIALGTKFSALGYLPAVTLALAIALLFTGRESHPFRRLFGAVPRMAVVMVATVFLAFSFHVRFWDPRFGSGGLFSWMPVELTGAPVQYFRWGMFTIINWMHLDNPAFFMGALRVGRLPEYFPAAFALKAPLGLLALAVAALAARLLARRLDAAPLAFILCALGIFAVASQSRMHIGVRHVHFVFPAVAMLAASLADPALPRGRLRAAACGLALAWCVASGARCAPHFIAHFNEIAGGPGGGWRCLADSNLDWGQDLPALARWCRERGVKELPLLYFGTSDPAYCGVPAAPFRDPGTRGFRPGLVAVSVSIINGTITWDLKRFEWARRMEPIARPGWSIHVYDLSGTRRR